jgi:hypothetical protein
MQETPSRFADACPVSGALPAPPPVGRIERAGLWLRDHPRAVSGLQWAAVALYLPLVFLPVVLPPPGPDARIWTDLTLLSQALLWGVWLPGVLVSVLLFGRLWCGLFCPEGTLSAAASRHGRGRAIPRWMKWPGWPFALFCAVTLYGQMIALYDDPRAAALLFGLSTSAALLVGWLYGKNKRVWCRFLCPMNGLFALLSQLAPLHYRVDARAWDNCPPARARTMRFNCEPMVPVRMMESAGPCHMCGRCAGSRDAVRLEARVPGEELVRTSATSGESLLLLGGLLGLGSATFWWPHAPWLAALSEAVGGQGTAPWFLVGSGGDAMSFGAGAARLLTILTIAAGIALWAALPLALAAGKENLPRLARALLPLAAAGLLVGFGQRTAALLECDARAFWSAILAGSALWSLWLAARFSRRWRVRGAVAVALSVPLAGWGWVIWS